MTVGAMDLLAALESPRAGEADAVKSELVALLSTMREPWLVCGLLNYQMRTGSTRAADLLARSPEWQARVVLDRLADSLRGEARTPALALLGHLVRRQPLWLYQVASHPLLSQLLKLLLSERDVVTLMSGLLALVTLLPMLPGLVGKHFVDILEVLKRLAAWDTAWGDADDNPAAGSRRAHLQLGLYALFYNLYGMYPCNLLEFLRREYGAGDADRREIFNRTIRPMLDTVRLHPLLVTASKQYETQGTRFQKMEHHDILYECRRFSLEGTERPLESTFRARCGTDVTALVAQHPPDPAKASTSAPNLTEAQTHTNTTLTTARIDSNSIAYISRACDTIEPGSERWFSLAEGCAGAPSAPNTPLPPHTPLPSHADLPAPRTPLAHLHEGLDGGSPPEAAIEATPENTPVKDVGGRRFNFPTNTGTVRVLAGGLQHRPGLAPLSQPPSPLKKEPSLSRGVEPEYEQRSRERLNRVVLERAQAETTTRQQCSPRRPGSVPDSPLPIGAGAPACGSTEWPLAKPQPQRDGVPLDLHADNKEDREVTELTMRSSAGPRDDAETPRGPSEPYGDEWAEDDACEAECSTRGHGLHMPPSVSSFAKLISRRFRYYSQCGPERAEPCGSLPEPRRPARDPRSPRIAKVSSCPDLRKGKGKTSDMYTQTVETWPAAYELALSDMFAGVCGERARRHATPAPVASLPADALDKYIEELVRGAGAGGVDALREQLQLTHAQLQYERHRKEVHATRNRRLLGKCRKNRVVEERAAELADRLAALQTENGELRAQTARLSAATAAAADAARGATLGASERLLQLERELAEAKSANRRLATELDESRMRAADSAAQTQHLLAAKFELGARLERALRAGEASERLAESVRALQRELLVCGEREARLAEAAAAPRASSAGLERLLQQYRDEACAAHGTLAASASRLEAATARQAELEAALVNKDAVILDLKKYTKTMRDEFEARTLALEEKYRCTLRINQKLECRVFELLKGKVVSGGSGGSARAGGGGGSGAAQGSPRGFQPTLDDVTRINALLSSSHADAQ